MLACHNNNNNNYYLFIEAELILTWIATLIAPFLQYYMFMHAQHKFNEQVKERSYNILLFIIHKSIIYHCSIMCLHAQRSHQIVMFCLRLLSIITRAASAVTFTIGLQNMLLDNFELILLRWNIKITPNQLIHFLKKHTQQLMQSTSDWPKYEIDAYVQLSEHHCSMHPERKLYRVNMTMVYNRKPLKRQSGGVRIISC